MASFSSCAFVLESSPLGVFKGGDSMFIGEMPGITVLTYGGPSAIIDVTGNKGFFQTVLESFLWCPSVAIASRKSTTQYDPGKAMLPHFGNMSCPLYLGLQGHGFDAGDFCLYKDCNFGDTDSSVEDSAEAALVEPVEESLVVTISNSRLTLIESWQGQ